MANALELPASTGVLPARPIIVVVALAFFLLFGGTVAEMVQDWANDPDYGHGFLLLPLAGYLAFRSRLRQGPVPSRAAGLALVALSVLLFWLGTMAAEFFTRRLAALVALAGLVVYYCGWRQAWAWWLPFGLLLVTIPLPEVVLNSVTLPLQLLASRVAVTLLEFRHVPAELSGNIIILPGTELFVAEACSGLRSLSALFGMSLLIGGTMLTTGWARVVLLIVALPAALAANAFRVFLTGYLVYFMGPGAADGVLHLSAGIGVFLLALGLVAAVMVFLRRREGASR